MGEIIVSLSEEELSQIYGGIVVKKPVKVENSDHFPICASLILKGQKPAKMIRVETSIFSLK